MAQEYENLRNISTLLAKEPEELNEEEVEQFTGLLKRRILINEASREDLLVCGLFTNYQVASLLDYRGRCGFCQSFMELASLDGFGKEFVNSILPFVSLEHYDELSCRADNELTSRVSLRTTSENIRYGYAARYKFSLGDVLQTSLACTRSLDTDSSIPDAVCCGIEARFRRLPLRVVAGDFNARFGQGLALWTGSDFTSLNTPSSFMKRHYGVTPSSSFTGNYALTGLATVLTLKKISMSTCVAVPGIKTIKSAPQKLYLQPILNLNYQWRFGQAGMSHIIEFGGLDTEFYIPTMKTSCDVSMCIHGIDLFSELMYDWVSQRPSGVVGVVLPIKECWSCAALLRSHAMEHKLALSSSLNKKRLTGSLSAEMTLYSIAKDRTQDQSAQLKLHSQWNCELSQQLHLAVRVSERIRSWGHRFRTDLRSDLLWKSNEFLATLRLNALQCDKYSFLSYVEGGYKLDIFTIYLRQGVFFVDDWDDRIYAYERDVPGTYNSPAFYGRGVWTSLMSSWKLSDWCRIYFRAGFTTYPFMKEKKPGKAELRFQSVFDF